MLNNGTILQQRYKIVKILGQGGMGAVYLAEDQRLPTSWAIKEMKKEGLSEEEKAEAAELFQTEARLLSELRHRNLPRIVDFFDQNEQLYLVMDYVEGMSLEQRMREEGPIPAKFALELSLQITDVLDYLHTRENPIVFRDFKPGNVMLTPNEEVKLIDFGIARVFKKEASTDTKALGTPGYAAPEQYGKGQSGPRTDIYAFGATLHHALTGRDPSGEPFQFPPITDFRQDLPPEFVALLESCLNLRANERPESAFAVKRVLEQLLHQTGSSALGAGRATTTQLSLAPLIAEPVPQAPPSTPVSAPLVPNDSATPQVLFSPNVLQTRDLGRGDKATFRVRVKCDRPVTLETNSPALQVFPLTLAAGTTTCTVTLDSSQLGVGSVFEGAVEVESHDQLALPVKASIQAPRASLGRSVGLYTLCALTLIPVLHFFTTVIAGIIVFSTPSQKRQSLRLPWYLTLLFGVGWTIAIGGLIFGASQVDWSFLTNKLGALKFKL